MSDITIYHYNRCSKSRAALALLEEKGLKPEIRNYMEDAPSVAELKILLQKLQLPAEELVRKSEKLYKENFQNKKFSEEEWIEILAEHPRLIQRPIVIKGNKAAIGRPPGLIQDIL